MMADNQKDLQEQSRKAGQVARNQAMIGLILTWLNDDSSYDKKVWPVLQAVIEENRLSERQRFGKV